MRSTSVSVVVVMVILLASAASRGQVRRDGSTSPTEGSLAVIELKDGLEDDAEQVKASMGSGDLLIGMEAYREVLHSGDYLVGPGDKFLVHVSEREDPVEVPVLAEGGLFIPYAGRAQVGGLTLRQVRAVVDSVFRRQVRMGTIAIELSQPRRFPVSVVGLVRQPGIVEGSGVERVSEVIRKAGGLSEAASQRNIYVVHSSQFSPSQMAALRRGLQDPGLFKQLQERALRVDLALYEVTGESALNPFLTDGDVVIVPARRFILRAMEAVRRSDTYEFVEGDRLSDLVALAMGPAEHYDPDNTFLFRWLDDGTRQVWMKVDLDAALAGSSEQDVTLEAGDWLVVRSQPKYQQRTTVQLIGEVVYAGNYVIEDGITRLRDVIQQAGGFTELASLPKARIVRKLQQRDDPEFERIITIPPGAWNEEEKQYFNMRSREKRGQMVVDFVALFSEQSDETQNISVRPGDVIMIPSSMRTILISGRAASPGAVPYEPSFTIADYIERAGGFGWRASKEVRVIKARTGEVLDAEDVGQIDPGDNIWIKEKPTHHYWTLFTQVMSVAGQVATVLILVGQ